MKPNPIEQRIPDYIRAIDAYTPGRPIEEVERELGIRAIKLASNENPLGPSRLAVEAGRRALGDANWYPDGSGYYLREKLAERLNVNMEHLMLGAGSCELIDVVARTLLVPGGNAVSCEGSFPLYYSAVRATGERLTVVPLREFAFDLDGIARAVDERTAIIYLANPNNPTGTMFTADALAAFLPRIPESTLVVLDEAYFEYAERPGYSRSLDLVRAGRNLLMLRTFSKVYGLAGLRVGYAAGPAGLIEQMNKVRQPFNVSGVALAAALAALDDAEHVRRSLENNRRGLEQIEAGLRAQGVAFVPSVANFVLVHLGPATNRIVEAILRLGVIVRPMAWMGFPEAIRVSVGTPEENEKFLGALAQARGSQDLRRPEAVSRAQAKD
ncbi:MAG TPA: histidinol-phosphate transaminase [Candidatus Acidoferrales bacterium]|nr:histidinol-phosphate transaminase [Candidatus Acidoferrales bacterium]